MSKVRELLSESGEHDELVRLKQPTDDWILQDIQEVCRDVPGNVADRIDRHPTYVSDRMKQLEDYGLVENTGRSVYTLTEKGVAYLNGNLDDEDDG